MELHIVSSPRVTPRKMQLAIWTPTDATGGVATHFALRAGHRDLVDLPWWGLPTTVTAGYRFECQLRIEPQPWTIVRLVVHVPSEGACWIEELPARPLPTPAAP